MGKLECGRYSDKQINRKCNVNPISSPETALPPPQQHPSLPPLFPLLTTPFSPLLTTASPGHEILEVVESEEDEAEVVEESAKPKSKKKGKNSPATTRKDRSATPDVSSGGIVITAGIFLVHVL